MSLHQKNAIFIKIISFKHGSFKVYKILNFKKKNYISTLWDDINNISLFFYS